MSNPSGPGSQPQQSWWPGSDAFRIKPTREVPADIQRSFLLWMGVAGLVLLGFVITLSTLGSGFVNPYGAVLNLIFAAAIVYGAAQMRLGKAFGRLLTAIVGGVLGILQLIGLLSALSFFGTIGSLFGGAFIGLLVVGIIFSLACCALIVAAMVYMFRPEASQYLS